MKDNEATENATRVAFAKKKLEDFNKQEMATAEEACLALCVTHLLEIIEKQGWQPLPTLPKQEQS